MNHEYRSIGGVRLPYPTSFKDSCTQEHRKKKKKKKKTHAQTNQKAGIQRHYKSTNPMTRTSAKIITDVRRRPTKPKPRKGNRSRSFSRHQLTISHKVQHSANPDPITVSIRRKKVGQTKGTPPPRTNNRRDDKTIHKVQIYPYAYKDSTLEHKDHTNQYIRRNFLPPGVFFHK